MDSTETQSVYEGQIIDVVVTDGEDKATFHLHLDLLRRHSPYFKALQNFREGTTNTVELTEVKVEAFRMLVRWIYKGQLAPTKDLSNDNRTGLWIDAYALADRLMMTECKNTIIDRLQLRLQSNLVGISDIRHADRLDHSSSLLAQYLKDQFFFECGQKDPKPDMDQDCRALIDWGSETAVQLMVEMHTKAKQPSKDHQDPAKEKGCKYHDHSDGGGCHRKTA